jgi:hypothetical protein
MNLSFALPKGNKARVGNMTLNSNGKVDRREGNVPEQGIVDIMDKRVESFTRSIEAADLGDAWSNWGRNDATGEWAAVISGNFGKSEPSVASQFVNVHRKKHTVTIQTQDIKGPFFNHWIQARFNPQTGQVNPKTITEWVSH